MIHNRVVEYTFAALLAHLFCPGLSAEEINAQTSLIINSTIPSRIEGVIEDRLVQVGDRVKEKAILMTIDDRLYSLRKKQSELEFHKAQLFSDSKARLEFARKAVAVAEAQLRRSMDANQTRQNTVTSTEIDELGLVVERSRMSVDISNQESQLSSYDRQLKETQYKLMEYTAGLTKIQSPVGGIVVEVFVRAGEWVSPGDPVARVIRLDPLRVEGFLDASVDVEKLKKCELAFRPTAKSSNPIHDTYKGTVVFVSPEVDPVNGQVLVRGEIANPSLKLRPGVRGKLAFVPKTELPTETVEVLRLAPRIPEER